MDGIAGNAMDNAAAALDNDAGQVRSDDGNKADALNKAVKKQASPPGGSHPPGSWRDRPHRPWSRACSKSPIFRLR